MKKLRELSERVVKFLNELVLIVLDFIFGSLPALLLLGFIGYVGLAVITQLVNKLLEVVGL